ALGQNGVVSSVTNSGTLNTVSVSGTGWNVGGWIDKARTLSAASPIDHLYVSDTETPVMEPRDMSSRLRMATGDQPLTVEGSAPIKDFQIHGGAKLAKAETTGGIKHLSAHSAGDWQIGAPISKVESFTANTGSQVDRLTVTDTPSPKLEAESPRTITLVTASGEPLKTVVINEQATVEELALGQNGVVNSVTNSGTLNTVSVSGTGWNVGGWISGANKLKTHSSLNNVYVSGSELDKAKANLKFTTSKQPLNIETADQGKIKKLTLGQSGQLGSANGLVDLIIKGNEWNVRDPITDLKRVLVDKDGHASTITSSSSESPPTEALNLSFSAASTKQFIITNRGTVDQVDFSEEGSRPPMGLIQEAGAINKVKGNLTLNDQITLKNGTINEMTGVSIIMAPQSGGQWQLPALNGVKKVVTKASPTHIEPYAVDRVTLSNLAPPMAPTSRNLWLNTSENTPVGFLSDSPNMIGELHVNDNIHFGSVKGVENIVIKGTGWKSHGFVEDIFAIAVEEGGTLTRAGTAPANLPDQDMSLNLAFKEEYEEDDYFIISNQSPQSIGEVDFSTSTARPNLLYVQDGGNDDVVIKGNTDKNDAIYIMSGDIPHRHSGISEIGFAGEGWADKVYQDKRLHILGGKNTFDLVKAISLKPAEGTEKATTAPISKDKTVFFAYSDEMPTRTTLLSLAKVDTVDFSDADRSNLTYSQLDGETTHFEGNSEKDDRLVLWGGNFKSDTNTLDSIIVKGRDWNAPGTHEGVSTLKVKSVGKIDRITLLENPAARTAADPQTLTLVTTSGKPLETLTISKGATVDELEFGGGGSVSKVDNKGTLNKVNLSDANWVAGGWIDRVNTLTTSATLDHLYVSDTETPVMEPRDMSSRLRMATGDQPLTVEGSAPINDFQIHGGAKLTKAETTGGIKHLSAHSAGDWQIGAPISKVESFTANTGSQVD
ncbi:hypothetical protein, partial [Endozoicomonas numazuensis]|uniref:hypothetical protein n=1 Tax=Endozoicomonas numazuensis TaxID=1137799 RepID=UPI00054D391F